jgi:general secretion pathway protein I
MNKQHQLNIGYLGCNTKGFTLIEVLLALAIIAISLTALLKASAQNVANTYRLKEKTIQHLVAMQGVSLIQLGALVVPVNQEITNITTLLSQRWYWRASLIKTSINHVEKIIITTSTHPAGPFGNPLVAFKYQL